MTGEVKVIVGIMVATVLLVAGIAFFGGTKQSPTKEAAPADPKLLVRDYSPRLGNKDAKVTIVEFADFQCPACGNAHPEIKRFMHDYQDRIQFVFRHFPLPQHQNAVLAARAAEAAGAQGQFWPMHDKIYEHQADWSEVSTARDTFLGYAKDLNLSIDQFTKDLENPTLADHIASDQSDGNSLGVDATPTIYIDGKKFANRAVTYNNLKDAADSELGN